MARRNFGLLATASLLLLGACAGLDVSNPNNPDVKNATASPEDVKAIAISTINSWYETSTDLYPYMMAEVTSDHLTANFGNFGMRFNNLEPRIAYENNSAGGDRAVAANPWDNNYGALGAANDVLKALASGVQINPTATTNDNKKWQAIAGFTQAATLSNLSLIYDSAFVIDESFNPNGPKPTLVGYAAMNAAATTKWDALITLLGGQNDTYTGTEIPLPVTGASGTTFASQAMPMTSAGWLRLSNTMAALSYRLRARTPAELNAYTAADWTKIFNYADKGISGTGLTSFNVTIAQDFNTWYSYINYYGAEDQWTRVDYRLINRMDNVSGACANPVPIRYSGTADQRAPGCPTTNDQRLGDGLAGRDYRYYGVTFTQPQGPNNNPARTVIGDPARGIWMQSAYAHERYQTGARSSSTGARTPSPYILAAENDLLIAEALVKLGTPAGMIRAAGLINNTRVTRGGLAALTGAETAAQLLAAIDYERDVELLNTSGHQWMYARSSPVTTPLGAGASGGRIQDGTVRHLPIPAKELETLALKVYTYGGVGKPDMFVAGSNGQVVGLSRPPKTSPPAAEFFTRK